MITFVLVLNSPTLVYWTGLAVLILLTGIGSLTVIQSIRISRREKQKAALKPTIRTTLFTYLQHDDPDWESWVTNLTTTEREVLRELLDSHLRLLEGADRDRLQPLATALHIDQWAIRKLKEGDQYEKLIALSWLAYIDHQHIPALIRRICTTDAALRAAGARVMSKQQYTNATEYGTQILLNDPTDSLTAFGLDTLYELTRSQPDYLVQYAKSQSQNWSSTLLIQVLQVLQKTGLTGNSGSFAWIIECCKYNSPDVRAAAIRTLSEIGWRSEIRARIPVKDLLRDPSTVVRSAVYEMLGTWGDAEANQILIEAVHHEPNYRCRIHALQFIYHFSIQDQSESDIQSEFPELWDWATTIESQSVRMQ